MDIHLNFINRSNDANNSQIVIFQKNVATNVDEPAVAWHVIENCAVLDNHPFTFPQSMAIAASDSYGNDTPQLSASYGRLYHVLLSNSGHTLESFGMGSIGREIQLRNDLSRGAINASIYRDGRLLGLKTNIAPGQKAVFEFKPSIWIAVASQMVQGAVLDPAIVSGISTELSLLGIASADIVMSGGGPGRNAMPFSFTLENINMA